MCQGIGCKNQRKPATAESDQKSNRRKLTKTDENNKKKKRLRCENINPLRRKTFEIKTDGTFRKLMETNQKWNSLRWFQTVATKRGDHFDVLLFNKRLPPKAGIICCWFFVYNRLQSKARIMCMFLHFLTWTKYIYIYIYICSQSKMENI